METDDEEYYLDEFGSRRKKRPRTPPDMCGVCGATSTPEWRKGRCKSYSGRIMRPLNV